MAYRFEILSMRFEKALDQGPLTPSAVEAWGVFSRLIEVGDDLYALRHIDIFVNGRFLRYDRTHWVDAFGMLVDARSGRRLRKSRRWQVVAIETEEFEAAWKAAGNSKDWQLQVASASMSKFGPVPPWLQRAWLL